MTLKFPSLILATLCLFSTMAYSQLKENQHALTVVNYNDNVNDPLTANELNQILEAYGENAMHGVLNNPQQVKDIKNILRNRVEIVDAGMKDLSPLKKLSSVGLFNESQQNRTQDFNFNPRTFNPLNYNFNFYSREGSIVHVDNTSYYVVIKSQFE